jgi:hypothetical protein
MRRIATLATLLLLIAGAVAEEIKVKNLRPSAVITWLVEGQLRSSYLQDGKDVPAKPARIFRLEGSDRGLVSKGVTLMARDSEGILVVEGTKEQIEELKRYIALVDVAPAQVQLDIQVSCPTINFENDTKTTVYNNHAWQMRDERADMDLTIAPRVNDDGTLTIFVKVADLADRVKTIVMRVKPSETIHLRIDHTVTFKVQKQGDSAPNWQEIVGQPETTREPILDGPQVFVTIQGKLLARNESAAMKSKSR